MPSPLLTQVYIIFNCVCCFGIKNTQKIIVLRNNKTHKVIKDIFWMENGSTREKNRCYNLVVYCFDWTDFNTSFYWDFSFENFQSGFNFFILSCQKKNMHITYDFFFHSIKIFLDQNTKKIKVHCFRLIISFFCWF